jgi:translocation and assembly module TamB
VPPALLERFHDQWPSTWKTGGRFEVQGGLEDLKVRLDGTVHEASIDLDGRLALAAEPLGYDLTVKLATVTPEMLSALGVPGGEVYCESSPVSVRLRLQGAGLAWPPPEFSWQLQAEPFTFRDVRVDKLDLKAAGSAAQQTLESVLCSNLGGLSLKTQGSFFKAPQGEFTLLLEDVEPGRLGVEVGPETSFSADITGKFSLPEPTRLASLRISGDVKASGSLEGNPVDDVQGRFTWEQPRLTLQGVRAEVGNVAAELSGTLDGDRLAFNHQGKTRPGGDWPIPATLKGGLTWTGTLAGTVAEPRYTLESRGQGLAVGPVALDSFNLRAQGLGLPPRRGALEVRAGGVRTPAGTFQQAAFNATGEGSRWRYHLKTSSPPPGPLAELAGSVDLGTQPRSLLVDRLNLHLAGISVHNRGQVQARFSPGLDLPTASFTVNGGTVQLTARMEGDQVSGRLEVRQLPLDIARIKDLKGLIQAQVTLSGSVRAPSLDGTVRLTSLQWQQFAFQTMDTALSYRGKVMKVSGKAQEGPAGIGFAWHGTIPLQLSVRPFQVNLPEAGLDLALTSTGANLKLLTKVRPEISKADVPVDLQVRVRGNWRQPEVEAHLRWQQGTITLTQAGTPYTVAPGTCNWQGNRLSLPQLTLESGGTVILSGDVDFQSYHPRMVRARAAIDNFKVLDRLASQALVNGEVNLNGPLAALVLRGRLFIPQATLNPALMRPSTRQNPDIVLVRQKKADKAKEDPAQATGPDFYQNMKIDLSVEAPDNVWIKQKTPQVKAAVELTADVRLSKRPREALAVGGLVRSREGTLDVFNKEFKVEKAMVTFPGVPNQQPVIEARASHEMTDAVLLVDVHGPVNKPQIDLSSSPPMPPNDLMAYLLFGRPAGELSQQEFNAEQQAVGVLGGITASKIQEVLGDDFPILGDITVKSTAGSIGLTKTLAKGVNISVERQTSPTAREDPTVVRLQYRINRYLRLQAEQGQRNTGGDVLFKYDF